MASDTGIRVATVREQRPGPDKMIYLKRMADFDRLISICSDKLAGNPTNVRALMIRASSYMKKGTMRMVTALLPSVFEYYTRCAERSGNHVRRPYVRQAHALRSSAGVDACFCFERQVANGASCVTEACNSRE